jgi:uncharacterized coiled-coil protein SlyX
LTIGTKGLILKPIPERKVDTLSTDDRLMELESKAAYLEDFIQELNSVVLAQDKTIKNLALEMEELRSQISGKEPLPEDERPPHY